MSNQCQIEFNIMPTWLQNNANSISNLSQTGSKMIPTCFQYEFKMLRTHVPNCFQNDAHIYFKTVPNCFKMIPAWFQHYAKLMSTLCQNDAKRNFNMIPKIFQTYANMISNICQNDFKIVPTWLQHHANMISKLFQTDFNVISKWCHTLCQNIHLPSAFPPPCPDQPSAFLIFVVEA